MNEKESAPQEAGKADDRSYEEILEEVRSFTTGDGSAVLSLASKEAGKVEAVADEPVAYMYQHEETGQVGFVDEQQVEWGFFANNPRLQNIGPLYLRPSQQALSDEQLNELMPEPEEKGESWSDQYGYERWEYHFNKAQVLEAMRKAILAAAGGSQ